MAGSGSWAVWSPDDVAAYRRHMAAKIERILGQIDPEIDIPTCADFAHLGEECCSVCHGEFPDDIELIEIEFGGKHGSVARSTGL
jgi:hypothetical protein